MLLRDYGSLSPLHRWKAKVRRDWHNALYVLFYEQVNIGDLATWNHQNVAGHQRHVLAIADLAFSLGDIDLHAVGLAANIPSDENGIACGLGRDATRVGDRL